MPISNIVSKDTLRHTQLETMEVLKDALIKSFGPYGSNTIIYKDGSLPRYTKDGHTILSSIQFNGAIEKSVHADIEEETRTQAVKIGDSTTSITILSALIFKALVEYQESSDETPGTIVEDFKNVTDILKGIIRSHRREATIEDMYNIALISTNNNVELANKLKVIYEQYGLDVYVDVKASMNGTSYVKEIDGMTLECGFLDPTLVNDSVKNTCDIMDPKIYAFKDPIDTMEMGMYLDIILKRNIIDPLTDKNYENLVPTIIMAPKISRDYSGYMDQLMASIASAPAANRGFLNIITDITGSDTEQFEDICDLCGCKYIKKYLDPEIQKQEIEAGLAPTIENLDTFAGTAELVSSDAYKTTFVNPKKMFDEDHNYSELFNQRIDYLEKQIAKLNIEGNNTTDIYTLKKRLHSLKGKMVEVFIGGVTVADRDSERDLMEDATLNCRSAALNGVGFGANFEGLRAAYEALLTHKYISAPGVWHDMCNIIYKAYREISYYLYESSGMSPETINDTIDFSLNMSHGNKNDGPYNIVTEDFDGKVISSIDTDICSLDTISKIITIMATSNQFILPTLNTNIY